MENGRKSESGKDKGDGEDVRGGGGGGGEGLQSSGDSGNPFNTHFQ